MNLARRLLPLVLLAAAACGPAPEPTPEPQAPPADAAPRLEIRQPRANVMPGGMGAVYFSIVNPGASDDRLLSVETAAARAAEIHETVEEEGVMRMVPHPEGLEVPAGGTVELAPGGKHVMLVEPRTTPGQETLSLTLRFERAGAIEVEAPLAAMGAMNHEAVDHEGMDHEGMDHEGMDHEAVDHEGMDH